MDWMHLLFAACATGFGGLAWGYRTQAAAEREQITYLRKQLGDPPAPTPTSRALASVQGASR